MTHLEYWLLQKSPLHKIFRTPWFHRYPSWAAAEAAIPRGSRVGYNQTQARDTFVNYPTTGTRPSDYAATLHLTRLLRPGSRLVDLGGNIGMAFYTMLKLAPVPPSIEWVVCDVPRIVEAARNVAEREAPQSQPLSFVTNLADAGACDIFLSSGTLQFLEPDLPTLLVQLPQLPPALLINRIPVWDRPAMVTLHDIGFCLAPYTVFNRSRFLAGLEAIGYRLADNWPCLESTFSLRFHPRVRINSYQGFLFTRDPA